MKVSARLIGNLRQLVARESIPYSALPLTLAASLIKEGLLSIEPHGSKRRLRAPNPEALKTALATYSEALTDLDAAQAIISGSSRAEQSVVSGNSKLHNQRSCPGFLVNSYSPIDCILGDQPFTVNPPEGTAVYIADWQHFAIPPQALVVGVENMENFLRIREQRQLIDTFLNETEACVLFVARYAYSSDQMLWLQRIPNRYLHFGDFDLAGIAIYLNQFKPYVDSRGSYLIPSDIEQRISCGSRKRYDDQYDKYNALSTADPALSRLLAIIHHHRRCYDQEGYIPIL